MSGKENHLDVAAGVDSVLDGIKMIVEATGRKFNYDVSLDEPEPEKPKGVYVRPWMRVKHMLGDESTVAPPGDCLGNTEVLSVRDDDGSSAWDFFEKYTYKGDPVIGYDPKCTNE